MSASEATIWNHKKTHLYKPFLESWIIEFLLKKKAQHSHGTWHIIAQKCIYYDVDDEDDAVHYSIEG